MRVRRKVVGTPDRPRLAVRRSLKHMYCQIIDDYRGRTLVSIATTMKNMRGETGAHCSTEAAREVGKKLAETAVNKGIKKVVFDRSGYKYHGRIKAVAEGAREAGLEF